MSLIDDLRQLVSADTDEYVVAGVGYWSDAQLQAALNERRELIDFEPITYAPRVYGGGSVEYKRARVELPGVFEAGSAGTASNTSGGTIQDGLGGTVAGWALTKKGEITFTATTAGSAYYFTGYAYDIYAAAADVLDQWCAHLKLRYDVSTDDQSFKRSQMPVQLRAMAGEYRKRAQVQTAQMVRDDVAR